MRRTFTYREADSWRRALGLLPVPLLGDQHDAGRFVLLNGASGNFCLDFVGVGAKEERCSAAWSSDVGHYVTVDQDIVIVNRWDRRFDEERYSLQSVAAKVHDFHKHLEQTSPTVGPGIVRHVLRVFRQIRTILQDDIDGRRSLQALLYLLASCAEGERLNEARAGQYGLDSSAVAEVLRIPEGSWEVVVSDFMGSGRYEVLTPDASLILRHASGALFQEAHTRAKMSGNSWFPGFEPPANLDRAGPADLGVHFTPSAVARTLAEEAVISVEAHARAQLKIFDPACGSGELLKESLRLLRNEGFKGNVQVIGWDRSAASTDLARFILLWELRSWEPNRVSISIETRDSLLEPSWPSEIDILIMNPPFQSWQNMSDTERDAVTSVLEDKNSKKPNLAIAFAHRAFSTLSQDAVLAMITPNSILEGVSAAKLRREIGQQLDSRLIAKLGSQNLFSQALVDPGMYVGRTRHFMKPQRTAVLWADSKPQSFSEALRSLRKWRGAETEPINGEGFSVYLAPEESTSGGPWVARSQKAWSAYQLCRQSKVSVTSDKYFTISQGVRLGSDLFVVSRDYVAALPHEEQEFFRPAIMNASIVSGKLLNHQYVFYPYTNGVEPIRSEEELEGRLPTYYRNVLRPARNRLTGRKTVEQSANLKWWDLLRHCKWQKSKTPRIVSKYFGDTGSFAYDHSGEFVVVVGYGWILKAEATTHTLPGKVLELATLAYLSSTVANSLLQYVSVQVSGGQWDLSTRYLRKMLIPNWQRVDPDSAIELANIGEKIGRDAYDRDYLDEVIESILFGRK